MLPHRARCAMREAVIVSSVRTAVGKAPKGTLRTTRPDDLAAAAIKEAVARAKGLDVAEIEDVIIGCATPEAEQGMNVARIAALRAGLPVTVSAMTINRFCSSGLQAIALAARADHGRTRRRCGCGGRGVHEHGAHGRAQNLAESLADGPLSGYLPEYGTHCGEPSEEVRVHAGAGGPILAGKPSEGARRDCGWEVQGRDCSHGSELHVC